MGRVRLRDVAAASGYSIATVSRVLGGSRPVKDQTARRVLAVSDELGYRTDHVARALRSRSTATIGMVVPQITNPFFPDLVRETERALNQRGRALLLCDSDDDPAVEAARIAMLLDRQVDGLIVIPCDERQSRPAVLSAANDVAVVLLDRRVDDCPVDSVTVDNDLGIAALMEHLRSTGRSTFAFVGGQVRMSSARERLDAYRRSVSTLSPESRDRVRLGTFSVGWGHEAANQMLAEDVLPDAVVCGNDLIAIGVIQALHKHGVRVPEHVAVSGFDDIGFAVVCEPPLTTSRQPAREMSGEAVRLLEARIGDGNGRHAAHVRLAPELLVRGSTAVGS